LDWFHQKRNRVRRNCLLQSFQIAIRDQLESRREGPKAFAILRLARKAYYGCSTTMKVVGANDDLGLVLRHFLHLITPFAGRLDRSLHSLRSRIHRQHHLISGEITELLAERSELIIAKCARSKSHLTRLFDQGFYNSWMTVALIYRGISAETIKIFFAFDIPDPDAFSSIN